MFWNTLKLNILSLNGNVTRNLRVMAYFIWPKKVKIVKIIRKDNRLPAAKFPCFVTDKKRGKGSETKRKLAIDDRIVLLRLLKI